MCTGKALTTQYQWVSYLVPLLGGARPKASVVDEKGQLWIAKFPSGADEVDIGGWEKVVNNLAQKTKINCAHAELVKLNSSQHTFLSKRFDRNNIGERIHFAMD